jgi:anti-sigma regulatory factor (Ser/Thr protein kinase)
MSRPPSIVTIVLESDPDNLSLVRGMLGGLAELLEMDAELLDDLKTAVSEAANNVVMHAYPDSRGPMKISLYIEDNALEVAVFDEGVGISEPVDSEEQGQGVGIPVMQALAQHIDVRSAEPSGTEVRMLFGAEREGRRLFTRTFPVAPEDGWTNKLDGDAIVSLSPVPLLSGVLGRLARAAAANARFSLDRFSDVYLVTDSISAHAARAANSDRMGFSLRAEPRRLELTVGPFARGTVENLERDERGGGPSPLKRLSDELATELDGEGERLRLVMIDHRR